MEAQRAQKAILDKIEKNKEFGMVKKADQCESGLKSTKKYQNKPQRKCKNSGTEHKPHKSPVY